MFWQKNKQKNNNNKNLHNYLLFAETKTGISQGKRQ